MSAPLSVVARTVLPRDAAAPLALYVDGDSDAVLDFDRHSLRLSGAGSVSFGSYFNAFPAAYWQAETALPSVRLAVATTGSGTVVVWRSDADARPYLVERRAVAGSANSTFDLPLSGFDEGGAYWFDLSATGDGLTLDGASWAIARELTRTATVVMATYNRAEDCLNQLRALSAEPELSDVIDRVVVVDQGTDRVESAAGAAEVFAALGDRLIVVRQRNLGGSGGFSRGMWEAIQREESDGVLLLDDDALTEPEAVLRAVRFAEAAREPLIVGGGMLHIDDRAVLYAQSEQWDRRIGWVRLNRPGAYDHDFGASPFRSSPFQHRLQVADFNGWWMCLIPTALLRSEGLAMPVFLKGDDVEFGLRAQSKGVRTVSLPGVALWHLGWRSKAPTRTWEAYFLHRNRLITELLHSRSRRPALLILHSLLGDMKPLLTLQYSAVRLRAQAIADVDAGPARLPGWLATRAIDIRALWARFDDAVPVIGRPVRIREAPRPPRGPVRSVALLVGVIVRHLFVPAQISPHAPATRIPSTELGWWSFAFIDDAIVETPDGEGVVYYRRDRAETSRALRRSIRLHLLLWWRWPRLSARFRDRAPDLASPASWARVFADE